MPSPISLSQIESYRLLMKRKQGRGLMQATRSPRWYLAAAPLVSGVPPCASMAVPSTVEGIARVIDGDTLELAGERIRLWGIDAPERSQTCRLTAQALRCGE